uniref:BZIP domain-containing protein n=1 Tax=Ananas comosus var. bracteatus TaxID=296719 RepID=A0A6V7QYC2_ANACO
MEGEREETGGAGPNPNPSSSGAGSRGQCRSGGMVEVELDAARALADMAAIGERSGEKRTRKRAENESSGPDSVQAKSSHEPSSGSEHSYLVRDHREGKRIQAEAEKEPKNLQLSVELSKLGIHCSASQTPLFGSRGKQNLTEAEKEAKRLRRVLANRESARQTIRRRQALREELTRKVADLSLENQNMKMKKEIATEEYLALKDTNKRLKAQETKWDAVAKTEPAPQPVQTTVASPTKRSAALHSTQPLVPYIWRSLPARGACYEQGNPSVSGPGPPFSLPQEEEEEEEVPCSLTLAIDEGKKATIYDIQRKSVSDQHVKNVQRETEGGRSYSHEESANAAVVAAAAEARKRRKELTKLKQMHGRQFGFQ